jgi:hypothetical protein
LIQAQHGGVRNNQRRRLGRIGMDRPGHSGDHKQTPAMGSSQKHGKW